MSAPTTASSYDDPAANDFLAVNQVTVTERDHTRRPDVVLFVNGLPLGVIELKNPADEDADIWTAWQQLQTYKAQLPSLFSMNELLVVSRTSNWSPLSGSTGSITFGSAAPSATCHPPSTKPASIVRLSRPPPELNELSLH